VHVNKNFSHILGQFLLLLVEQNAFCSDADLVVSRNLFPVVSCLMAVNTDVGSKYFDNLY